MPGYSFRPSEVILDAPAEIIRARRIIFSLGSVSLRRRAAVPSAPRGASHFLAENPKGILSCSPRLRSYLGMEDVPRVNPNGVAAPAQSGATTPVGIGPLGHLAPKVVPQARDNLGL